MASPDSQDRWTRRAVLKFLSALPATALLGPLTRKASAATAQVEFTFIHLSDTHLDPRPRDTAYNPNGRSVGTLRWLCEQSKSPLNQPVYGVEAGKAEFAIHTGDVFEYSVIDQTWSDFDRAFSDLACPLYYVPGNHDNTWSSINARMRERFGGDSHSFDAHGCHFVCLNSAGLLDPLPCMDRRTVEWLRQNLSDVHPDTPVFLGLHHPLSENAGYASLYDKLRVWDVLRDHHIVLMMDGHWHQVHARRWQGFDRVNGGETFRKFPGFSTVTVRDGRLRVMYRFEKPDPERNEQRMEVPLIDKPMDQRRRSPIRRWEIAGGPVFDAGVTLEVGVRTRGRVAGVEAWIEGDESRKVQLAPGDSQQFRGTLQSDGLAAGRHALIVRATRRDDGPEFFEGGEVELRPPGDSALALKRRAFKAGFRATPEFDKQTGLLLVADTAGRVSALDADLETRWEYDAGTEIVNGLTLAGELLVVADADGGVTALEPDTGTPRWQAALPNCIYGTAAVHGTTAIIGDAGGHVQALSLENGDTVWRERHADYGFEAAGCVEGDTWYGSAWDAFLYAVDVTNGRLRWKSRVPSGFARSESRYFGGADTTPAVVGDRVFATDRGYTFGVYDRASGEYRNTLADQVAAFRVTSDGTGLLTRRLDDRLTLFNLDGDVRWEAGVDAGRAPARPCLLKNEIVLVSDRGMVSRIGHDGVVRTRYQVSPRLFVLAEPVVAWEDCVVTADMDGVVTTLAFG